jgi:hypothetical protein
MENKNLWILTEERPKDSVVDFIVCKFAFDRNFKINIDKKDVSIVPVMNNDDLFSFIYKIEGYSCKNINNIFIATISGTSSFVDFLIFYQNEMPSVNDQPIYAIEETKTDDSESRNTGVYQRCTKFVYIDYYYKNVKKIMLYNLKISQKESPTDTYIFGTRCLLNLNVEITGKKLDSKIFKPFKSIDDMINFKNQMRRPPAGNVPILIKKENNDIKVSGRLWKAGSLSHDPNIGALSLIFATIRSLGWRNKMISTHHGLKQDNISKKNKFIKIANMLNIEFDELSMVKPSFHNNYWKYEKKGEKIGSIFVHMAVKYYTDAKVVFENHAGSEKGYYYGPSGEINVVPKYRNKKLYKLGNKEQIIQLSDLIIVDHKRKQVINIEGEQTVNLSKGVDQLKYFDGIEDLFIKKDYPDYKIIRTIVLFGGNNENITNKNVGLLLNDRGDIVLGPNSPELFIDIKNKYTI